MSNIFNFKRFYNYFVTDLRNAKNQWGLSFLICVLMPVMVFFITEAISYLLDGEPIKDNNQARIVGFVGAYIATLLISPSKIYGNLTDKKSGSDFLLLPVSTFEKWLSMVLVSSIVIPLALAFALSAIDALMGTILLDYYGAPFISSFSIPVIFGAEEIVEGVSVNFVMLYVVYCCCCILPFTLGAVYFKKSKVAKTILSLMAISMVFSAIGLPLIGDIDGIESWFDVHNAHDVEVLINNYLTICYIIYFVVCGGALFLRLKTLKH